ncbi:DoxX family protein [Streptomyces resistomycificus]|uniref:DoxX family protein n=1 Tax=Streptomyces resistomycificus TaxID=67356 RepID=A0A0L8LWF7_9ACTN|nr:DoxX family protein [Streptomyces resistomycificus]KOG42513.1 DoxX family protein [Streptomyces resistomycificus]KUN92664.1 DoxX family protein [Streptomyces resistomycificus]
MSLLRLTGRPLLASMFVAGGLNSLKDPEAVAPTAEPVVQPVTERVAALPDRTEQVVRLSGAVQVAAGVLLGMGRVPRVAALAIAGTLVPTTLAAHRFWEAEDPSERAQQRIQFLKNLSMLGGLLIAADDTAGHAAWWRRGRHTAHDLRRETRLVGRSVRATAGPARAAGRLRAKLPA